MDVNTILGFTDNAISLVQKMWDVKWDVKGVKAKMDALEMSMGLLSAKKDDISDQLEQEERKPGRKRKREVHLWMDMVPPVKDEVGELGRKVRERPFLSSLTLPHRLRDIATQVERLLEKGRFDHGLTLDVEPARGYELQPGELVGQSSQTKRDEIWDCLMNEEVLQVGIWGHAGAGKTFLGKHIHDQIVRHSSRFDGACWVTVSQEGTVLTIQTDIANYLELDLTKVSRAYWGARLEEALRGRRLLFILDDVGKCYPLKEVGIALERNGCKLIMTSRSREVCERMNCHELVHVSSLPEEIPQGLEEEA